MNLYNSLSNVSFLKKSYTNKFFFVAFLGIHIPLIGLIITLIFNREVFSTQTILFFTLIFTLIATAVTLYVINKLMVPINMASRSLTKYRRNRIVPNLPMKYRDEAGRLLYNVQRTINDNENYLNQKQDLISLLTHDIKNYAIQPKSLATLLLEETDMAEIQKIGKMIATSADNQLDFLESFIHLLREEEALSNVEVESNTINLVKIIDAIEGQLREQLQEKNIQLKKDIGCQKANLLVNEMLLSRVIFNLMHNAIKFSHPKSDITVSVVLNKEFIAISVRDNGIGFKASQKNELFSKFSKMSRKGTFLEDSIGIGLYLCSQIAAKFSGYIDAHSEGENTGAVFTVGFRIDQ